MQASWTGQVGMEFTSLIDKWIATNNSILRVLERIGNSSDYQRNLGVTRFSNTIKLFSNIESDAAEKIQWS